MRIDLQLSESATKSLESYAKQLGVPPTEAIRKSLNLLRVMLSNDDAAEAVERLARVDSGESIGTVYESTGECATTLADTERLADAYLELCEVLS